MPEYRYRKYLISCLVVASSVLLLFCSINVFADPFALFSHSTGKSLRIVTSERPSKYLFSFRYIPENFDGILVGPSLSDHLDTKLITSGRVYNLSLQGANVAEMRLLARNVMEKGHLKLLLICLDPYILRNMHINDERMQPYLVKSALGSTFMLQYYSDLLMTTLGFGEQTSNRFGPFGNLKIKSASVDAQAAIRNFVNTLTGNDRDFPAIYFKDSISELNALVAEAHTRNIKVAAFFFPPPEEVLAVTSKLHYGFRQAIMPIFADGDILVDFTSSEYAGFRADYSNYSDQGHASEKGARFIIEQLNAAVSAGLRK